MHLEPEADRSTEILRKSDVFQNLVTILLYVGQCQVGENSKQDFRKNSIVQKVHHKYFF